MQTDISAQVIEDSISDYGIRLTTLQLRFPRFILAEFNTHRDFSRNARSTRAVPTKKLIEEVRNNPFVPVKWLKNQPGMQGTEPMDEASALAAESLWRRAAFNAADFSEKLFELGLHKQWSGRLLEPFMYVDALVSSTHWANFDALRDHTDAQPEIEILAQKIIEARDASEPNLLMPGQWHLPYVTKSEKMDFWCGMCAPGHNDPSASEFELNMALAKLSTARCARVSFKPFDGNADIGKEFERFEKLVGSTPIHASPTEHQATPDTMSVKSGSVHFGKKDWDNPKKHGNFFGWNQHRKYISNEYIPDSWETVSE